MEQLTKFDRLALEEVMVLARSALVGLLEDPTQESISGFIDEVRFLEDNLRMHSGKLKDDPNAETYVQVMKPVFYAYELLRERY